MCCDCCVQPCAPSCRGGTKMVSGAPRPVRRAGAHVTPARRRAAIVWLNASMSCVGWETRARRVRRTWLFMLCWTRVLELWSFLLAKNLINPSPRRVPRVEVDPDCGKAAIRRIWTSRGVAHSHTFRSRGAAAVVPRCSRKPESRLKAAGPGSMRPCNDLDTCVGEPGLSPFTDLKRVSELLCKKTAAAPPASHGWQNAAKSTELIPSNRCTRYFQRCSYSEPMH